MFKAFRNRRQSSEEQIDELLSAYLDDMLTLEDRALAESRLRQEPDLVARLDGLRQTKKLLANLPQVQVPRNFILSPSMVSPAKPIVRPRQRQIWPVFGWATAAATLLFLLVFAGDLFFVKPSPRPQPSDVVAQKSEFRVQTPGALGTEVPLAVFDAAPPEAKAAVSAEAEEAMPAAAAPQVMGEAAALPEEEARPEVVGTEPAVPEDVEQDAGLTAAAPTQVVEVEVVTEAEAPAAELRVEPTRPAAGGGEPPTVEEKETAPTDDAPPGAEAAMVVPSGTLEFQGTSTPEIGKTAVVTATLPAPEFEEIPLTASPSLEGEGEDSAIERQTLGEAPVTATPDAVAAVSPNVTPLSVDAESIAEDQPAWLRPLEIVLVLAVVGLGAATLVIRRREV